MKSAPKRPVVPRAPRTLSTQDRLALACALCALPDSVRVLQAAVPRLKAGPSNPLRSLYYTMP